MIKRDFIERVIKMRRARVGTATLNHDQNQLRFSFKFIPVNQVAN